MYKHKTTLEQYNIFKKEGKNPAEVLYRVYLNETNNNMSYDRFIQALRIWILMRGHNLQSGVEIINKNLKEKFAGVK